MTTNMPPITAGLTITAPVSPAFAEMLTPEALEFVALLQRQFGARREALLDARILRQAKFDAGHLPDFLPETAALRAGDWRIAPIPADLRDRRVEITGPVERKMIINALNSGAKVFMADFEDSHAPTWEATIQGQINLCDAVRGTISYTSPEGKVYHLSEHTAVLMVRPRGWHLPEKHVLLEGQPIAGALFDFGLYFFHNAKALLAKGTGPYFYLPKMESHHEAQLWDDIFTLAERERGLPHGSIKATVLIETLPAAFEMDEILSALRDHSAGLNCGRWDYIFSAIKKRRKDPSFILPDRALVTMTSHFMRSYSLLLIQTCHRRGAHAMGGMAANIPIKGDPAANERALAAVRADKEREAGDGHDGTWVAHPGLVPVALEVFDCRMPTPNQIDRARADVRVTAADLLAVPAGPITEAGARTNIRVGVQYLAAWLGGLGCVPLYHLMEDAATAEISRAQLWQWVHDPRGVLDDGRRLTLELYRALQIEEMGRLKADLGAARYAAGHYDEAAALFDRLTSAADFADFLTLPAYEYLD
ncbi:MAG: malate synthase A [Ktedonobacterales bacterium]|nr:malate synthase A [Ktedonobacterales bacterium]